MDEQTLSNLERVYDAFTTVRKELSEARLQLSQKERDNDENPVNKAYRTTCAYWRLLRRTIDAQMTKT